MASMDMVQYRSPLRRVGGVVIGLFLAFYLIWTLLPLLIMFVSSFKELLEAFKLPAVGDWGGVTLFFDFSPTFKHYHNLFADLNFTIYLFNSIAASLGSALISVVLGSMSLPYPRATTFAARRTCSSGSSRRGWRRWWR